MESEPADDATLFPATVGEKLRAAREAQGLELVEIAARTRIPQRHLEAIEKSNYAGLPSTTYAMGFAKAYARAVGVDEVAIARDLRGELSMHYEPRPVTQPYNPGDPAREPPRGIIWVGVAVAVAVLIGVALWYGTSLFRGSAPPPESLIPVETPAPAPTAAAAAPAETGGQVVLTALDTVWLRVTDDGKRLFEKEMKPGERYEVPQDAVHPIVRTGRADQIEVTLNGTAVAPLGPANQTVNLDVSADAVRARAAGSPAPVAATTPAPSASAPLAAPSPASAPAAARTQPVRTPRSAPARPKARPSPRPSEAPGAPANLLAPITPSTEAQ